MYSNTKYQHQTLVKTKQAVLDVIKLMEHDSSSDRLTEQQSKQIQMRFQALLIDLKKARIEIPFIAMESNNPQCLNNFNKKQLPIVESMFQKYKAVVQNFDTFYIEIENERKKRTKTQ